VETKLLEHVRISPLIEIRDLARAQGLLEPALPVGHGQWRPERLEVARTGGSEILQLCVRFGRDQRKKVTDRRRLQLLTHEARLLGGEFGGGQKTVWYYFTTGNTVGRNFTFNMDAETNGLNSDIYIYEVCGAACSGTPQWGNLNELDNFFDINHGVCHQVLLEQGFAQPGGLVVGSDSHTTSYGAVGCLSAGIGRTEAACTWATITAF